MSGDPEQEYFADGVVEDILTALARFPSLRVIARNSSFIYKGKAVDLRAVGRTLGVRYALEGSVRKSGQRIRIVAQLIETETGTHLWADKLDGDLSDIFALQDEITEKVVTAIEPRLKRADIERSARARPSDLGAYDLYLRALAAHHRMDREGLAEAIELLRRCLDLDPRYGAAASLYSISQAQLVALGGVQDPQSAVAEVLQYARLALDLNKDDPDAIAWAGRVIAWANNDFDMAMDLVNRAVAANPNSANVWCQRGWVLVYAQRPAEALPDFERALKIGPLDLALFDTLAGQANAFLILNRFEEAVPAAYAAIAQNPRYASAYRVLAASLAHLGRLNEARAAANKLIEIDPNFTIATWARRAGTWQSRQMVEGLQLAGLPE
jgi:adenylate cyclase